MRISISTLLLALLFTLNLAKGQDIHFSQPENSPINMNPSLAGEFNGDYRVALNHRNQWSSVTIPYKTFSFAFDANLHDFFEHVSFGTGLLVNSDKAGDSDFGMLQFAVPITIGLNTANERLDLRFGVMPSYTRKSLNYAKLRFNSQFQHGMYDPDIAHGEILPNDNMDYFDLALGFNAHYQLKPNLSLSAGSSLSNITEPNQSLLSDNSIKLDKRFNFHTFANFKLNEKVKIQPGYIGMWQSKFKENNIGGNFKMLTGQQNITSIFAGTWYRFRDAFVVKGGFEIKNLLVGLSYDFNSSKLTTASNGFGGFEIALIYILHKKPVWTPKRPCPDFL